MRHEVWREACPTWKRAATSGRHGWRTASVRSKQSVLARRQLHTQRSAATSWGCRWPRMASYTSSSTASQSARWVPPLQAPCPPRTPMYT